MDGLVTSRKKKKNLTFNGMDTGWRLEDLRALTNKIVKS